MISTDFQHTGAGTVTPPAVGLCAAGQVVLMAPSAAPWNGTGLPFAGTASQIRLRGLIATGASSGVAVHPSIPTTAVRDFALVGVPVEHTSAIPGDLPPEDPPS